MNITGCGPIPITVRKAPGNNTLKALFLNKTQNLSHNTTLFKTFQLTV